MNKFYTLCLLGLFSINTAFAGLIGNDAIDRSTSDGWNNFIIGQPQDIFTESGFVTDWSVYTSYAGTVGALVLRNSGTNLFDIVSADYETVAAGGLHDFSYTPDSGVANVLAGDIIGIFIGTARVDFDFNLGEGAIWTAGGNNSLTTADLYAGNTITLNQGNNRTYSMNMTVVPEPSIIALFGLGLVGLGFARRKIRS